MAMTRKQKQLLTGAGKISKETGLSIKQSKEVIETQAKVKDIITLRTFYNGSRASISVLLEHYQEPIENAIANDDLEKLKLEVVEMLNYCKSICNTQEDEVE